MTAYQGLLFMSVEQLNGRTDCGTGGAPGTVNPDRFRGIRVFDVSDPLHPVQVAAVQTCRGSHTHTLVTDPDDPANVYIYNSSIQVVRPAEELAGCTDTPRGDDHGEDPALYLDEDNPTFTSRFLVEVIRVPLATPETAEIVNHGWYQGGISVVDFTDQANPVEIAFFDRGPVAEQVSSGGDPLVTFGGSWSAYYHRGHIFSSEIARGLDVLALTGSEHLDEAELAVAALVDFDQFNPQHQPLLTWPASFELVRAKYAQALRTDTMSPTTADRIERMIGLAERFAGGPEGQAAAALLRAAAGQLDGSVDRQAELAEALRDLADEIG